MNRVRRFCIGVASAAALSGCATLLVPDPPPGPPPLHLAAVTDSSAEIFRSLALCRLIWARIGAVMVENDLLAPGEALDLAELIDQTGEAMAVMESYRVDLGIPYRQQGLEAYYAEAMGLLGNEQQVNLFYECLDRSLPYAAALRQRVEELS